jgi:hypothetical protein
MCLLSQRLGLLNVFCLAEFKKGSMVSMEAVGFSSDNHGAVDRLR